MASSSTSGGVLAQPVDLDRRHASTRTTREATSTASTSHVHDPEESCDKEKDPAASVATTADEQAKPVGALVVPPSCGRNDANEGKKKKKRRKKKTSKENEKEIESPLQFSLKSRLRLTTPSSGEDSVRRESFYLLPRQIEDWVYSNTNRVLSSSPLGSGTTKDSSDATNSYAGAASIMRTKTTKQAGPRRLEGGARWRPFLRW
ncbi:unnamed protein product, partial [Amoebophrya sp. A25]|eukprot:GSA25T00010776001.1